MIFDKLLAKRFTSDYRPSWFSQMAHIMRLPIAGVRVDEHRALTQAAVWACIRIISESIAVMPWGVFRQTGAVREAQNNHAVNLLLARRPNPEMTPLVFKRTLVAHAVSWGNGYAEIERNRMGDPIGLWPITPDRVRPDRDSTGALIYHVTNPVGGVVIIPAIDMFHLPGLGFDGVQGYSVITMARESISLGMATEQFGAAFFGNGAQPGLVISQEAGQKSLTAQAVINLIDSFRKKNAGPANSGKVNYLDAGLKITTVGIPQKDAQFLETRKFQILEICRWFRVPPHKLADLDRATFSNIESQGLEFIGETLLPWVTGIEQEADFKLFKISEADFYTKLNMDVFMRGDSASRTAYYSALFDRGVYSIDDILSMEDRNPLPDGIGALRMVPLNFVSVETAFKSGGSGTGGSTTASQKTQALWRDVAQRMVNKEIKALERICTRDDALSEAKRFYQMHAEHITQAFAAVAAFDGRVCTQNDAAQYCSNAITAIQSAIESESTTELLAAWRTQRAPALMHAMGCPHV